MITDAKIHSIIFMALAILLLIDIYAYSGLKAALSAFSKFARRIGAWVYWCITVAFFILVIITWFTSFSPLKGFHGEWYQFLAGALVLLYITKIVFIIFLAVEDVYRLIRAGGVGLYKLTGRDKNKPLDFFQSRRRFISQAGALVAGIPFISIIYGVTKGKYNFKVHKAELAFKDLPPQFNGLRIVQVSDIHSGSFNDRSEVLRGLDIANAQKGDIIFFTGDLVNNRSDEMDPWMDVFNRLKAPMGVYSILGNHDYGDYVKWPSPEAKRANLEKLFDIHKQLGYRLMRNENLRIEKDGAYIDLIGLENWGKGGFSKYGDFKKAMEGTTPGSFKILLSHDPSQWDAQVTNNPEKVHLTLSGHTHGAQFGVEIPGIKFSPIQFRYKQWAGLYKEDERYIYVNRGFGFIGFPGRVGIWPEITVITLKTA